MIQLPMRILLFTGLSLLVALVLSCNRQEIEPRDTAMGFDYFPLKVGNTRTYTIDSLIFDPALSGTIIDTLSGWAKEIVTDTFHDAAGMTLYRIERFERKSPEAPWQIKKVFAMGLDTVARQAIRVEDNLRFVPLIFPVKTGTSWDGNRFLDEDLRIPVAGEVMDLFGGWSYSVESQEAQYTLGALNFDDVITVRQAKLESIVELRGAFEVYSKSIGLIYREWRLLDTQCIVCCNGNLDQCEPLPWEQKAERGFILRQQLVSWE